MLSIVTDSACDLPRELVEKHNITLVPLQVNIDGVEYREGEDITPRQFYEKMLTASELPRTSQPAPATFAAVFRELSEKGQVLCLTLSSKLSGTYQSACLGKKLSVNNVTVFDTLAGSLGQGLQVIKAAEMAKLGVPLKEIIERLTAYRQEMRIYILLNTLENIVKGGRLSKFQGSLAKMLDIKILLEGVNGAVELREKIRGKRRFLQRALEVIEEQCQDFSQRPFGITHLENQQDMEYLRSSVANKYKPPHVLTNYMGSTMGTYAGKGGIIIAF